MIFSSCLREADEVLTADASVLINLIASNEASRILEALPARVVASEAAIREISAGAVSGRPEAAVLKHLVEASLVTVAPMSAAALEVFSDLVSGSLAQSLGDGEAATVAIASLDGSVAAIDEKKATRVCAERFPNIRIATSVDILASGSVSSSLGKAALASAVLRSLTMARMQVRGHQLDWIIDLVGIEEASKCGSLQRLLRTRDLEDRRAKVGYEG